MGTRFVATHECDADIKFKEAKCLKNNTYSYDGETSGNSSLNAIIKT
jgi:hypothetical protein